MQNKPQMYTNKLSSKYSLVQGPDWVQTNMDYFEVLFLIAKLTYLNTEYFSLAHIDSTHPKMFGDIEKINFISN